MTGRAAGYCAGYDVPGYANPAPTRGMAYGRGYGMGYGMGYGRGYGRGYGQGRGRPFAGGLRPGRATPYPAVDPYAGPYGPPSPQDERTFLENQAKVLQDELSGIRQRLDELTEAESPKD